MSTSAFCGIAKQSKDYNIVIAHLVTERATRLTVGQHMQYKLNI